MDYFKVTFNRSSEDKPIGTIEVGVVAKDGEVDIKAARLFAEEHSKQYATPVQIGGLIEFRRLITIDVVVGEP